MKRISFICINETYSLLFVFMKRDFTICVLYIIVVYIASEIRFFKTSKTKEFSRRIYAWCVVFIQSNFDLFRHFLYHPKNIVV